MSVTLDPALNGLVGSTTTQELDGVDQRVDVLWLPEETNTPWTGTGPVGAVQIVTPGSFAGADGDYAATQVSSDGAGVGVEFTVTIAAGVITVVSVVRATRGTGYVREESIVLVVAGITENSPADVAVTLVFGTPGVWSESMRAADGTALVIGQVLRHGVDTLAGMTSIEGVPQGRVIAYDLSGNSRDPGRNDLDPGSDVRLVYQTAEEAGRA